MNQGAVLCICWNVSVLLVEVLAFPVSEFRLLDFPFHVLTDAAFQAGTKLSFQQCTKWWVYFLPSFSVHLFLLGPVSFHVNQLLSPPSFSNCSSHFSSNTAYSIAPMSLLFPFSSPLPKDAHQLSYLMVPTPFHSFIIRYWVLTTESSFLSLLFLLSAGHCWFSQSALRGTHPWVWVWVWVRVCKRNAENIFNIFPFTIIWASAIKKDAFACHRVPNLYSNSFKMALFGLLNRRSGQYMECVRALS